MCEPYLNPESDIQIIKKIKKKRCLRDNGKFDDHKILWLIFLSDNDVTYFFKFYYLEINT